MTESNELALMAFTEVEKISKAFYASGLFKDIQKEAQATVKIMAGKELGIKPFAAMQGLHIIEGALFIKPMVAGALIRQHPNYDYEIAELNDKVCSIKFYSINKKTKKWELQGDFTYTIEMAIQEGLGQKENYKRKPWDMLFARAMGKGQRKYCPDVTMFPTYVEGEIFNAEEPTNEIKDNINKVRQSMEQSKVNKTEPVNFIDDEIKSLPTISVLNEQELKEDYNQIIGVKEESQKSEQQEIEVVKSKKGIKKSKRPYSVTEIKERFEVYSKQIHKPIPDFDTDYWVRVVTNRLFELTNDIQITKKVLEFFVPDLKNWTEGQIVAIKLWLNLPEKEVETWKPLHEIKEEINLILGGDKTQNKFF